MGQECRHVDEIAGLRARREFAALAPAHFAYAGQHICDGLLLAIVVNSRAGVRLDLEHAAPHRRFDAELRRNCSLAFRAAGLQRALVEFRRVNNADCGGIAHRFNWVRRSKARDLIAASPTNLAARSGSLYPPWVLGRRALVARAQTLV